jgi:hypothetical protein
MRKYILIVITILLAPSCVEEEPWAPNTKPPDTTNGGGGPDTDEELNTSKIHDCQEFFETVNKKLHPERTDQENCRSFLTNKYCIWKNQACVAATDCSEIPVTDCFNVKQGEVIEGKACKRFSSGCEEVFDCDTLAQADCNGRLSTKADILDERCHWLKKDNKCYSTNITLHSADKLYGSNGTVCVDTKRDKIGQHLECFGDGLHGKLPLPKLINGYENAIKIAFGEDFGCAEKKDDNKVVCWGDGEVAKDRNIPTVKIKEGSLVVNQSVACAIEDEGPKQGRVRCWGKVDTLVSNIAGPKVDYLKFDDKGYLGKDISSGFYSPQIWSIALGDDFICARTQYITGGIPAILNKKIVCSGKKNFNQMYFSTAENITNLTAGRDFACVIGIQKDKAYCFKQAPVAASVVALPPVEDDFIFTDTVGGKISHSENNYIWISAQGDYVCGSYSLDDKPECFGTTPAALPTGDFSGLDVYWSFGENYMCGRRLKGAQGLLKCSGTNNEISNNIPQYLSAP